MGFPIPDSGEVTEDENVIGGNLVVSGDIDFFLADDTGDWTPETIAGAYGSQLVIDADGNWTYTADNSNAAIQALDDGESLTEQFTVTSNAGTSTITTTINGADEPPCFTAGTMIATPHGPRLVEELRVGDLVVTQDSADVPLRWIGRRVMHAAELAHMPSARPRCIPKDAIAPGVPDRDTWFSPLHRILLAGPDVALQTGFEQVLSAVKHLGARAQTGPARTVEYIHLVFDKHEVVTANGIACESFLPGDIGLAGFDPKERADFARAFPDLAALPASYGPAARPILRRYEAAAMSPLLQNGLRTSAAAA